MVWAPKAHDYLQIRNNKIEWPKDIEYLSAILLLGLLFWLDQSCPLGGES